MDWRNQPGTTQINSLMRPAELRGAMPGHGDGVTNDDIPYLPHMVANSLASVGLKDAAHRTSDVTGWPYTILRGLDTLAVHPMRQFERMASGRLPMRDEAGRPNPAAVGAAFDVAGGAMTGSIAGHAAGAVPRNAVGAFGGDLPHGVAVRRSSDPLGHNYEIINTATNEPVGSAYVKVNGDNAQVGRISLDDEWQRKGIGTSLYGMIEKDIGKKLQPDDMLSDAAYAFWNKHQPNSLAGFQRPAGGAFWERKRSHLSGR